METTEEIRNQLACKTDQAPSVLALALTRIFHESTEGRLRIQQVSTQIGILGARHVAPLRPTHGQAAL